VRTQLGGFGFSADKQLTKVANLSGGVFKRLAQNDGVVLTTGLPVDIEPSTFGAAHPLAVRKWHAMIDDAASFIAFQVEARSRANELVAIAALREGMVLVRDLLGPTGALLLPSGTRMTSVSISRIGQLLGGRHQVEVADAAMTPNSELRCA